LEKRKIPMGKFYSIFKRIIMDIKKTTVKELQEMKPIFWHLLATDAASTEILYSDESLDFILQMHNENIDKFSPEFIDLCIVFDDFRERKYFTL
jgi:hypothetical protein